ncbi:MAG: hypothetical protein Q4G46_02565, partial [Propionibacteriaceae bacterium]|nr:hypothetical protein [Propionibacteriaceae bacterium]
PLPDEIVEAVLALGLVPSPAHERVRNIVASPLSGWWPRNTAAGPDAVADVRGIVAELDQRICADAALAGLSGRFLFAIDDGRGDMLDQPFDVAYLAEDEASGRLLFNTGSEIPVETHFTEALHISSDAAASVLVDVAKAFQRMRVATTPAPWHVRELDAGQRRALLTEAAALA